MTTLGHRCHPQLPLRGGFTLVELVVVIAVITLLAGLLLPALRSSIDATRNIACLSNLKQISLGMTQYAADNNGYAPPAYQTSFVTYFGSIDGYFHQKPSKDGDPTTTRNALVVCPGAWHSRRYYTEAHARSNTNNALPTDYYITFRTNKDPAQRLYFYWGYYLRGVEVILNGGKGMDALSNIRHVSTTQTAHEKNDPLGPTMTFTYRRATQQVMLGDVMYATGYAQGVLGRSDTPMGHNLKGGNVVFLDNHAQHTPIDQFMDAYYAGRWWRDFYVNRDCGGMGWRE